MRTRRIAFVSVLAACAAPIPAAPAMAASDVTVMTRNIYLGADIVSLATAPNKGAFEVAASDMFRKVEATNFPVRAPALADEIKAKKPDLVGLQEVALWRTGPKDDAAAATTVKYDFLTELLAALKAKGSEYTVVTQQQEFDFEGPTLEQDVRLTMRDVILKRKGSKVKTSGARSGNYKTDVTFTTAVGPAKVLRGWTMVEGKVGKKSFRFVNTHLEAFGADVRNKQAQELFASGGPLASKKRPSILLGDLNSDPADKTAEGDAIRTVAKAGFTDVYGKGTVRTFGRNELLTAEAAGSQFIDHILYRSSKAFKVKSKGVTGTGTFQSADPKWSSDHNGVFAKLSLR